MLLVMLLVPYLVLIVPLTQRRRAKRSESEDISLGFAAHAHIHPRNARSEEGDVLRHPELRCSARVFGQRRTLSHCGAEAQSDKRLSRFPAPQPAARVDRFFIRLGCIVPTEVMNSGRSASTQICKLSADLQCLYSP